MQKATVACPSQGTEAYFTFKEPMLRSLQSRLGVSSTQILLRVSAVNEMREMLQSELRDPFLEAYAPANIEQSQYKQDLRDNLPVITFKYTTPSDTVKYVRVPLSFLQDCSQTTEVPYYNKTLVVDLGPQYQHLDLSPIHTDLLDFIKARTGIDAALKEVTMGDAALITADEHAIREAVRINSTTVTQTLSTQLVTLQQQYQGIIQRLNELGIVLGD